MLLYPFKNLALFLLKCEGARLLRLLQIGRYMWQDRGLTGATCIALAWTFSALGFRKPFTLQFMGLSCVWLSLLGRWPFLIVLTTMFWAGTDSRRKGSSINWSSATPALPLFQLSFWWLSLWWFFLWSHIWLVCRTREKTWTTKFWFDLLIICIFSVTWPARARSAYVQSLFYPFDVRYMFVLSGVHPLLLWFIRNSSLYLSNFICFILQSRLLWRAQVSILPLGNNGYNSTHIFIIRLTFVGAIQWCVTTPLTILHSQWPKLNGVLAILSSIGLRSPLGLPFVGWLKKIKEK